MKAKGLPQLLIAPILLLVLLVACETPPCPSGSKLMGAPPPEGQETWCQKIDAQGHLLTDPDGKPLKDGPFVLYWPNGQKMIEGNYTNGKQDGYWSQYYDNGQKASVDEYHGGVLDGLHVSWFSNSQKSVEGQFKAGKKEGLWRHWDPNGLKNWTEDFKDDKKVS
jgi:hypothetical protein